MRTIVGCSLISLFINLIAAFPGLSVTSVPTKPKKSQNTTVIQVHSRLPPLNETKVKPWKWQKERKQALSAWERASQQGSFIKFKPLITFVTPIRIGGKTFHVMLDTGSADLWVPSTQAQGVDCSKYSCYKEQGKRVLGESFRDDYADNGTARGPVYADTVEIGTLKITTAVGSARKVDHLGLPYGLLGLSRHSNSGCRPGACANFMDHIGGSLTQELFTAMLRRDEPGSFDFGFIDDRKYTGPISYAALVKSRSGFWKFRSDGYAIGNETHTQQTNYIVDTGSDYTIVPDHIAYDYYSKIPGAYFSDLFHNMVLPCNAVAPDLSIIISGNRYNIPGNARFGRIDHIYCAGGVQPSSKFRVGGLVLGAPFLHNNFVVFDWGNRRIGFAKQRDS